MPISLKKLAKGFRVQAPDDLAVIVGSDDQAIPDPKSTTEKKERKRNQNITIFGELDEGKDRKAGYRDFRIIDTTLPEFSRALTVIATVATAGDREVAEGFRIEYVAGFPEEDKRIVEDLVNRRLALKEQIYGIIRSANKFGDIFKELIIDRQGLIWKLKNLEPELVDRVHDEFDRHIGYMYKGFIEQEQELDWWQVVHMRHDKEDGAYYGRSLFAGGGRELASRVVALRDGLTYETLNHATARNAIILARPSRWSQEQVDAWKEEIEERIAKEHVVDNDGKLNRRAITLLNGQDVVIDYPVDIEGKGVAPVVQPLKNAPIVDARNIAEHFQDIMFVVTGVPKAFMGIERHREGLGSGRLDKQDKQFTRQVFRDQLDAAWFVEEIIRRQFILLRRPLMENGFEIVFPSLRHEDKRLKAEITKLRYDASKIAKELFLPMEYVWTDLIFDGQETEAAEAAEKFGVDFESINANIVDSQTEPLPAGPDTDTKGPRGKVTTTPRQNQKLKDRPVAKASPTKQLKPVSKASPAKQAEMYAKLEELSDTVDSVRHLMSASKPAKVSTKGVSEKDFEDI